MLSKIKKLIPHHFFLRIWYHKALTWIAAAYYGFPARDMIVIGITGTDGKTTTSQLVHSVIKAGNIKVGLATTNQFCDGEKTWKNETHKTTLGRLQQQRLLHTMKQNECTHVVLEVSSHALDQGRIIGIPIDIAVLTNITPEHLDYHKTMANYRNSKFALFRKLLSSRTNPQLQKTAIFNYDDDSWKYAEHMKFPKIIGYGIEKNPDTIKHSFDFTLHATNIQITPKGIKYQTFSNNRTITVELQLLGTHNVSNSLAAFAVGRALSIEKQYILKGIKEVSQVAGRMEVVSPPNHPFTVVIDFAMTVAALTTSFETARNILTQQKKGHLTVVLGCCGDRDQIKRPKIGKLTSKHADVFVLTDDEPYTEPPEQIRNMIRKGVDTKQCKLQEIGDRKEAITYAIDHAKPGDFIIINGMGDFTSRTIGETHIPWVERDIVKECIENIKI